jgi:hypothetical protein
MGHRIHVLSYDELTRQVGRGGREGGRRGEWWQAVLIGRRE